MTLIIKATIFPIILPALIVIELIKYPKGK